MLFKRLTFPALFFLAACSPFQAATPLPVRLTIEIAITPALQPLSQALQACAAEQTEVLLDVIETPAESLMQTGADLHFRLGEPQQLPTFVAPIAWEEIVVITHPSNDVESLSQNRLRALFSGLSSADVQVWVPLEGDETRQAFESAILADGLLTSFAMLAPHPDAMLTAVAADRDAIGYLPKAWVTAQVKTFGIGLHMPVLIMADEEPQGPALILVSCLQGVTGQTAIFERYLPWVE